MRRRARSPAMRILADTQNALAAFRAGLTPPVLAFLAATWVLAALNPTPESWAATCASRGLISRGFLDILSLRTSSSVCSNGGLSRAFFLRQGAYTHHDLLIASVVETSRDPRSRYLGVVGLWIKFPFGLGALYNFFSPIARFQHLIASPFN
jgi:hypothetical protein